MELLFFLEIDTFILFIGDAIFVVFELKEIEFLSPPFCVILFNEYLKYLSLVLNSNDINFFLECILTPSLLLLNILLF